MNTRQFLLDVALTILVTFGVTAAVTYGYSLVVHGTGIIDWETAFSLALVLGIVLPLSRLRSRAK